MFSESNLPQHCITWRQNAHTPHIYDVELNNIGSFKRRYDTFECHLVVYPYSRYITAKNVHIFPYEEYVKDITSERKSAYSKIGDQSQKAFGLLFGAVITAVVAYLKPSDFFSVEALVSVFAAYLLGKDLWNDVERLLTKLSNKGRLRFQELYYLYELDPHTTLTNYSYLAKWRRYGKHQILPEKMDMIEHSNSQTVRLHFNLHRWEDISDDHIHLFSVHIDEALADQFTIDKLMLGLKMSFNRTMFMGHHACFELFQSADAAKIGCLDDKGLWHKQRVFYRHIRRWGHWKWFAKSGIAQLEATLIDLP